MASSPSIETNNNVQQSVSNSNSQSTSNSKSNFKFCSDFDKKVLNLNFKKRGWIETEFENLSWNFYWGHVHNIRQLFRPESRIRLQDTQFLNHFPNHYELTRKDLMAKNIKRFKRECQASGIIIPATFSLPADYRLFVEEYKRNPNSMWILKPSSKSRGIGIAIINKLNQIKQWHMRNSRISRDTYIISRYINNPLLIGGKKFDLRLYVLVRSFKPLLVYFYQLGFARFCNENYTNDITEIDNLFVHLTNVAIQKKGDEYNNRHGGKWDLKNLKLYIEGVKGKQAAEKLFVDLKSTIMYSLRATKNIMISDRHCFELYGYDILLDENLKPWLIEVNASPSLTTTTKHDLELKTELISDVINIVVPQGDSIDTKQNIPGIVRSKKLGKFEILYDEASILEKDTPKTRPKSTMQ